MGLRHEGLDPELDNDQVLKVPHLVESNLVSAVSRKSKKKRCNRLLPECTHTVNGVVRAGCGKKDEFCSVSCACISHSVKLPDLSLLPFTAYMDTVFISSSSCALDEKCVGGTGIRQVVKFDTKVFNQGTADFRLPSPPSSRPDLFEWAVCHGHWHMKDFLRYQLLDLDGNVVASGEKRSFCVMDMSQVYPRPDAPCRANYNCNKQGLSVGWNDVYDDSLDCQFIDATGVPPGVYIVRQCVNLLRRFEELSFENNCAETRLRIMPSKSPTTASPMPPTLSPVARCQSGCPWHWLGDGVCDVACNTTSCNFDNGDCTKVQCAVGCQEVWLGDNYCDFACNNLACNFDKGDCDGGDEQRSAAVQILDG